MADFELASEAFTQGGPIPTRHSCEGEDVSPALAWTDPPAGTASLALICEDPDAPSGTFIHWVAWGIDPDTRGLAEGEPAPREGSNGFGEAGYRGPCPPPGHGPHRYFFRVYALSAEPRVDPGAGNDELRQAMDGSILETGELMGTYERR